MARLYQSNSVPRETCTKKPRAMFKADNKRTLVARSNVERAIVERAIDHFAQKRTP